MRIRTPILAAAATLASFSTAACSGDPSAANVTDAGALDGTTLVDGAPGGDSGSPAHDASSDGETDAGAPTGDGAAPPQGIVSMSSNSVFEGETEIAVSPSGAVAISWSGNPDLNDTKGQHIGYTFWEPGSPSWVAPQTITAHPSDYATDSTVISDAEGNFYVAWLAITSTGVSNVWVAKAPKGNTTFGNPVLVSPPTSDTNVLLDKPWLLVTRAGTLLVSYAYQDSASGGAMIARSIDGGQTWKNVLVPANYGPQIAYGLPYLCVAPNAGKDRIYFTDAEATMSSGAPLSDAGSPVVARLHWSDDDGQSWPGTSSSSIANPDIQIPSCAAYGDDVWVEYGVSNEPNGLARYALRVAHFTGGGATLAGDVNATAAEKAPLFLGDQLIVHADGTLDLTLYAGAADPSAAGDFRHSLSTDMGATFSASTVVHAPIELTSVRHKPQWLGDYIGLRAVGNKSYVSYGDNQGADMRSHVAFAVLN